MAKSGSGGLLVFGGLGLLALLALSSTAKAAPSGSKVTPKPSPLPTPQPQPKPAPPPQPQPAPAPAYVSVAGCQVEAPAAGSVQQTFSGVGDLANYTPPYSDWNSAQVATMADSLQAQGYSKAAGCLLGLAAQMSTIEANAGQQANAGGGFTAVGGGAVS